jgi:hypothetical protein
MKQLRPNAKKPRQWQWQCTLQRSGEQDQPCGQRRGALVELAGRLSSRSGSIPALGARSKANPRAPLRARVRRRRCAGLTLLPVDSAYAESGTYDGDERHHDNIGIEQSCEERGHGNPFGCSNLSAFAPLSWEDDRKSLGVLATFFAGNRCTLVRL